MMERGGGIVNQSFNEFAAKVIHWTKQIIRITEESSTTVRLETMGEEREREL